MSTRRPWRALATAPDPTTPTARRVVGHCAASTEAALAPWIAARRGEGCAVTVQEVLVLEEPTAGSQPVSVA